MLKTSFKILKMDCPSEIQMIRLKLADVATIESLEFDIENRLLIAFHSGEVNVILQKLDHLNFDTTLIDSVVTTDHSIHKNDDHSERKLLWKVLAINLSLFFIELGTGFFSGSLGLLADSVDMLADSIVYGLALIAVGGTTIRKKNIAKIAGYFQLLLATFGLIESLRRFFGKESIPEFKTMALVSILALIGNALCLYLLQKNKSKDAHMQASLIFTSNDVVVNIGVILAAALVYLTNSNYPDLIVASIVFLIVARGALNILKLSK